MTSVAQHPNDDLEAAASMLAAHPTMGAAFAISDDAMRAALRARRWRPVGNLWVAPGDSDDRAEALLVAVVLVAYRDAISWLRNRGWKRIGDRDEPIGTYLADASTLHAVVRAVELERALIAGRVAGWSA